MPTIKKKDLKKWKPKATEQGIEELVDSDGSPINGDESYQTPSQIRTAPQQTTDDFAAIAIQPNRYYYGIAGTAYSHGARGVNTESIDELAKTKMRNMVEYLMNKKSGDREMVNKFKHTDVNRNQIPDLEELATTYQKPVVARKAQEVLETMKKNELSGEEIGIVINYIMTNIDMNNIPQDYRYLLKRMI